jgi:hypothetical protein
MAGTPKPLKTLRSKHFKDNQKLQICLVDHAHHVVPGSRGEHVGLIQKALVILGAGIISGDEIRNQFYGNTTVRSVHVFKGPPRNIINRTYQNAPDDIVGMMTIERLDKEMFDFENRPPEPLELFSLYVSVTEAGEIHDHSLCPTRPYATSPGADGRAQHRGTPIFPEGNGWMVNIWGEGETNYLGFKDYATHRVGAFLHPIRPLTQEWVPSNQASDICIRSSPIHRPTGIEMKRIAQRGCRFTYSSNTGYITERIRTFIKSMGSLVHTITIPENPGAMECLVISCDPRKEWRLDLLVEPTP